MYAKVDHPNFVWIPEIFARFGKRTESSRSSLLLPNGSAFAGWCERYPQVLLVPGAQRFGIMSAEEQPSDSGDSLHFRSSRFMFNSCFCSWCRTRWLCDLLCHHG